MAKGDKKSTAYRWPTDMVRIHQKLISESNIRGLQRKHFCDIEHIEGNDYEERKKNVISKKNFERCINTLIKMDMVEKEGEGPHRIYSWKRSEEEQNRIEKRFVNHALEQFRGCEKDLEVENPPQQINPDTYAPYKNTLETLMKSIHPIDLDLLMLHLLLF